MSYILSFVGEYLTFGLCALVLYLPVRFIYVKARKIKAKFFHEAVLMLFVVCLTGLVSQTLFPLFRLDYYGGVMELHGYFNSGNYIIVSKNGFEYSNENEIVKSFNLIPFKTVMQYLFGSGGEFPEKDWTLMGIVNMAGNLLLLFPIGFLLPLVNQRFKKVKNILLFTIPLIIVIEILQYFTGRAADIDDLILNTVGTLCGYLLLKLPFLQKIITKLNAA